MKINKRLYPHPVLSHFSDDLTNCLFQLTPLINGTKHAYKLEAIARTSSKDLVELLNNRKASYGLHVECPTTRYRRLIAFHDNQISEEINADLLDGKVELCSLIIANEDIPNYRNRNFHDDYGDHSFYVKKGDVLAISKDAVFDASKDIDPLKNVASILRVQKNLDHHPNPFLVDLSDNLILIRLSPQNFDLYNELRKNQDYQTTLAAMIVVPALLQTMEVIRRDHVDGTEAFADLKWFKVITKKLKTLGYESVESCLDDDDVFSIAQKLIGDPLNQALKSMVRSDDYSDID